MAKKGTLAYYTELLDAAYRVSLATYVAFIVVFWLYWVLSRHRFGQVWYMVLTWGIIEASLYYLVYFGPLPQRIHKRYGNK
jgi:hypothetical protein